MANCPYDKVSLFGNLSQGKLFHGKLSRGKKSSGEKSQSCRPIGYRNFPITFLSCALKRNKIEETNSRQFFFCERGGTQNYRARIFRRRTVRRKKNVSFCQVRLSQIRLGQIRLGQISQDKLGSVRFFFVLRPTVLRRKILEPFISGTCSILLTTVNEGLTSAGLP